MRKFPVLLAAGLIAVYPCSAQNTFRADSAILRHAAYSAICSPEKLYLHIDRTYFSPGETIWFMGYLQNSSELAESQPGNFIYAELVNEGLEVVRRVKVKRDKSGTGFPGYMELPGDLAAGDYTLRAYSRWQMNSSPAYMFHQKIRIYGKKQPKQIQPREGTDITFYPEGGRYFCGYKSLIGFKAMNPDGNNVNCIGFITDRDGNRICTAATLHDGMGEFIFTPEIGKEYFLTVADTSYPLPSPASEGATVGLKNVPSGIYATTTIPFGGHYNLLLRTRKELILLDRTDKSKVYRLGKEFLDQGINHLLLVDDSGKIVSERLFFIYGDRSSSPECIAEESLRAKDKRQLSEISLTLRDGQGLGLDGKCSVSVVRSSFKNFSQEDDIVSYMELSSELKGTITKPSYYFDDSVSASVRARNMDLLMLIQGWRYYDLEKILGTDRGKIRLDYTKEYRQSVSGRIKRVLSKRIPKNFIFSVLIPKLKFTVLQDVSEGNSFIIDDLDFSENTDFFIKAERPGMLSYLPKWDGDRFAPEWKYSFPKGGATLEQEKEVFAYDGGITDTLQAAVVSAEASDPFNNGAFGQSVARNDLETYRNRTLVDYISMRVPSFEYNGETMRNRRFLKYDFLAGNDSESEENEPMAVQAEMDMDVPGVVKLVVNESEDQWIAYESLYLEDIANLSYTTESDPVYNAPGGVVFLKLKAGHRPNPGMHYSLLYFVPLGYQNPQYFYSPRYDRGDTPPEGELNDHRNTVYWCPDVDIRNGRGSFGFCTTDQIDFPYLMRVEGLTSDGKPFSVCRLICNYPECAQCRPPLPR